MLRRTLALPSSRPRVVNVKDDAGHEAMRLEAEREAERITAAAERRAREFERRLTRDPELQQEWIRQDNLIYGGLMAIGVVMMQPFRTADTLDTSATICCASTSSGFRG